MFFHSHLVLQWLSTVLSEHLSNHQAVCKSRWHGLACCMLLQWWQTYRYNVLLAQICGYSSFWCKCSFFTDILGIKSSPGQYQNLSLHLPHLFRFSIEKILFSTFETTLSTALHSSVASHRNSESIPSPYLCLALNIRPFRSSYKLNSIGTTHWSYVLLCLVFYEAISNAENSSAKFVCMTLL